MQRHMESAGRSPQGQAQTATPSQRSAIQPTPTRTPMRSSTKAPQQQQSQSKPARTPQPASGARQTAGPALRLPSYGLSPSPSGGSDSVSASASDSDGDADDAAQWLPRQPPHAPTEEEWNDPLDQSGEFEGDVRAEMDELLAQADARAAAPWERQQQQQSHQTQAQAQAQAAAALNDSVFADSEGDDAAEDNDDADLGGVDPAALAANAELQQKISAERAMLSGLISQLTALQSQAAQLKQMTMMSHEAQSDMEQVLRDTRRHAQTEDSDAQQEEDEDEEEGDSASESSEDDEEADEEQAPTSNSRAWSSQAAYTAVSPSDSEIEVEIERQPNGQTPSASASPSPPAWSEDEEELSADAQQLAELEVLMAHLSREAEAHKAALRGDPDAARRLLNQADDSPAGLARQYSQMQMRAEAQTQAQGEGRVRDQNRSGTTQRGGRSMPAHAAAMHDADEEERMEKARRTASMRSPLTSASPSPPRVRERSRPSQQQQQQQQQQQTRAGTGAASTASSQQSPSIARVPARAVPPVPISRWIGPSTLPTALAGGGSGSHAQYADRPATAVGTARSVVQRANGINRTGRSQTTDGTGGSSSDRRGGSSGVGSADGVAWAAPTLSSLPRPRSVKAASVSSKGSSLFVNAPESEAGDRERAHAHARRLYGESYGIVEDSEEDEDAYSDIDDLDDSDALLDDEEDEADADAQGEFEASEDERILASIDRDQDEPDRESYAAVMAALQRNSDRTQSQMHRLPSRRQQAWDASASPEPSDSDADLPYTINPAAGARPKTARTAAATNLNGFAPSVSSAAPARDPFASYAPSDSDEEPPFPKRQRQQQQQQQRASSAQQASRPVAGAGVSASPPSSFPRPDPSRLSSADLQSVLAHIGCELFRTTITVGNTGAAARGLGAGRLGAGSATYHEQPPPPPQQQQPQRSKREAPRGYGFQPAQPAREWRPSSRAFAQQ